MDTRKVAEGYRLTQWAQLLQERKKSVESIDDFCMSKGISRNKYFYWQRKLREKACERLEEAEASRTSLAVQGFAEVKLSGSAIHAVSNHPDQVCIEIGNHKITAGADYPVGNLATLLRELVQPC